MSAQQIARFMLVSVLLLRPGTAWAQAASSGSIAGVVRDTSGAVVPGVTVEAASPALIEKVRTAVTDGQGQYKIVELRPGTYTVTFTLEGFATFKREGIELTTGFTAAANAELRVGALAETVTVTGASPVVDVQNVRSQTVLSRTVLDALPTNRTISGFAALTVGASVAGVGGNMQDVGGNRGEQYGTVLIHGSRTGDGRLLFDGMRFNNYLGSGGGQQRYWIPNQTAVTEVVLETSGMAAEAETGGVHQNSVPKDGGNTFSVSFGTNGAVEDMQNSNLTDRLRARGLTTEGKIKRIYDVGVGVGGPMKQDKLWFYTAQRVWGTESYFPGIFYNKTQGIYLGAPDSGVSAYTEDLSRRGYQQNYQRDHSLRLTWQAAQKHKVGLYYSVQNNCQCLYGGAGTLAPEALNNAIFLPNWLAIGTWSYPVTNRLLFEAGVARLKNGLEGRPTAGVTEADISITELSTGLIYNAATSALFAYGYTSDGKTADNGQHNERFSVSYITGSHAFKAGFFSVFGVNNFRNVRINQALNYRFRNGLPAQLVQWASPGGADQGSKNFGLYVQDQWTTRNLTLNLGLRFDYVNAWVPDQLRPGGRFVPALQVARVENVPNFTDLSPRLGAVYDLFGNGKTALKVALGRYVAAVGIDIAQLSNPAKALVESATRTWTDRNGDFKPDCNLQSFAANGECGALDNQKFGTVITNTRYAKDVLEGFGNREYNWQSSVSVQQELRPGVGVNVGYFRTWFGNFRATDNLLVTPADFDPFCITAPVDARLPGGGGYQICDGLGDVKPAKFGLVDNLVTQSSHYGKRREVYNGVDVTFNARWGAGKLLQGGMNVGRTETECVVVDGPVQFCKQVPPFLRPEFKLAGVYPLPFWGLQTSATLQSLPGTPVPGTGGSGSIAQPVNQVVTSAQVKPSLGRDLAQGATGVAIVSLFEPYTRFEDRLLQLDLRFTKIVRVGRARVQGMFDIYNIFNNDAILNANGRYGSSFLRPTQILGGRLFKFGAQLDF